LIEEFCRVAGVHNCQPQFFNRMQRELRDQVQPLLNERETLLDRERAAARPTRQGEAEA
jgi:hypothetical protein